MENISARHVALLPGAWSDKAVWTRYVDVLRLYGVDATLLWDVADWQSVSAYPILIGHSFGAFVALSSCANDQVVIAWNALGLSSSLHRTGWWMAILFRFPLVARLVLLFVGAHRVANDGRNQHVARVIAQHIALSWCRAFWKDPMGGRLRTVPTFLVQHAKDPLIPILTNPPPDLCLVESGHDVPATFINHILIILQHRSWCRKREVLPCLWATTPWLTFHER